MKMSEGPLTGVRVLEFAQIIAGPFCCMLLADMGAEVIKFEPLEGEPWRQFNQFIPGESRTYVSLNRGKQSIAIDLMRPEAREFVHRLVKDADVVVTNYRPGVVKKMGIDYETLSAINPRLIYCENTAFGSTGPMSHLPGYDIVVQAMTGLMAGEAKVQEGGVPGYIYPAIADYATGTQMSNSICAALYFREKTGKGQKIDSTLMGTALAIQTSQFTWIDLIDNDVIPPMLAQLDADRAEKLSFEEQVAHRNAFRPTAPANIYYRVYQTADGFLAMGALSNPLRRKVLAATGLTDPRFKEDGSFELQPEGFTEQVAQAMVAEAEALFLTKTTDEWVQVMYEHGVPAGPLYFVEELYDHPQTKANNLVVEMEHPSFGRFRMVGAPFQMSESPIAPQGPSPILGANTAEAFRSVGYSDGEIAALVEQGIIGVA
jgi:formyl-CoA transferase